MKRTFTVLFALFALSVFAVEPALSPEVKITLDRADKEYNDGKFQDAAHDYSQAMKLSRDSCQRCVEGAALANAKIGYQKDAFRLADKALAMAVDPAAKVAAHNCKGEVCLIYSTADPKKLTDAENEFRASVDLLPNNSNSQFRLGYVLLREKKDDEGIQHLQASLAGTPAGLNADFVKKLIANPRRAREQFAPDFAFTTSKGESLNNSTLEGKVVVFDFWATWCGPCRESVPEIRDLTKKYGDRLRVVSISADDKADTWRDFVSHHQMEWDQYLDSDKHVLNAFNVHAFPTYIVMNQEGVVVKRMEGINPHDSLVHRLRDQLNVMLK